MTIKEMKWQEHRIKGPKANTKEEKCQQDFGEGKLNGQIVTELRN